MPQMSRAPAPHPHTVDPFQEVKEYMLEAEDYAHFLNDKVNVSTEVTQTMITHYTSCNLCLWRVYCFHVNACLCPSVTVCFRNILKSHSWNINRPCKHIHIYMTNSYNEKIRARGQFYESIGQSTPTTAFNELT